jgi:hypothetical protein
MQISPLSSSFSGIIFIYMYLCGGGGMSRWNHIHWVMDVVGISIDSSDSTTSFLFFSIDPTAKGLFFPGRVN